MNAELLASAVATWGFVCCLWLLAHNARECSRQDVRDERQATGNAFACASRIESPVVSRQGRATSSLVPCFTVAAPRATHSPSRRAPAAHRGGSRRWHERDRRLD